MRILRLWLIDRPLSNNCLVLLVDEVLSLLLTHFSTTSKTFGFQLIPITSEGKPKWGVYSRTMSYHRRGYLGYFLFTTRTDEWVLLGSCSELAHSLSSKLKKNCSASWGKFSSAKMACFGGWGNGMFGLQKIYCSACIVIGGQPVSSPHSPICWGRLQPRRKWLWKALPQAVRKDMYSKKGAIRRVHGRGSYFVGCICIDLVAFFERQD